MKRAVNEPEKMVAEALAAAKDPHAHRVPAGHGEHQEPGQAGSQIGWGKRIQQALMTGVSYMIPFVAAGGLLIALGFLFGGYEIAKDGMDIALHSTFSNLPAPTAHALGGSATMTYIGAVFFAVGQAAFGFLLPALAGYIGFGLADRPGIAPGFVAGAVAGAPGQDSSGPSSVVCSVASSPMGSLASTRPAGCVVLCRSSSSRSSGPSLPAASCTWCSAVRLPLSPTLSTAGWAV